MVKKLSTSRSLVVASAGKRATKRKSTQLVAVEATDAALAAALPNPSARAKLVGSGGEVLREGGVTLVKDRAYATGAGVVPAEEVYYHAEGSQETDASWRGEADKIAWRDEASGYDCIVLRSRHGGYLSGYVGIPRDHPLWGWDHQAVPMDLGVDVHGGLTYSKPCEGSQWSGYRLDREARRVCHVPRVAPRRVEPTDPGGDAVEDADAWWFGFSCDHAYDGSPRDGGRSSQFMRAEVGLQYRDDGYVVEETITLASQLHAIANGDRAPERKGPLPPPLGLDPAKGGRE